MLELSVRDYLGSTKLDSLDNPSSEISRKLSRLFNVAVYKVELVRLVYFIHFGDSA